MFCTECGAEIKEGSKFCSICGAVLAVETTNVPEKENTQKVDEENIPQKNAKENKKTKLFIILIIAAVLAVVGLVVLLCIKNAGDKKDIEDEKVQTDTDSEIVDEKDIENDVNVSDTMPQITEFAGNTSANLEQGGNVVSNGEDVYFYENGYIYHMDKDGNVEGVCKLGKTDYGSNPNYAYLQLKDDILFYTENDCLIAYNLTEGKGKQLIRDAWGFRVDGDYVYYLTQENISYSNGYTQYSGARVIGKYSIKDEKDVERLVLGEEWANAYIVGKCLNSESEIIIGKKEYLDTESSSAKFTLAYTDLKEIGKMVTFEMDTSILSVLVNKVRDYIYLADTTIREEGYLREINVPEVISLDDWNKVMEKIDTKEAVYFKDYYKKYDINNLGKNDDRDELLENYPTLSEEVLYILRSTTSRKVKIHFEEVLNQVSMNDELVKKSKEMGGNKPIEKDTFDLLCINPFDMKVEYSVSEAQFIIGLLGGYNNDLIVCACIDDVAGIYRITEENLRDCGLNGSSLKVELLVNLQAGIDSMYQYNSSTSAYVAGKYLYYKFGNYIEGMPGEMDKFYRIDLENIEEGSKRVSIVE